MDSRMDNTKSFFYGLAFGLMIASGLVMDESKISGILCTIGWCTCAFYAEFIHKLEK
jgi:hypothetical protein